MQRSSVAVANLYRYVAHPMSVSEHFLRHGRHAGIVQSEVKMWISHALKTIGSKKYALQKSDDKEKFLIKFYKKRQDKGCTLTRSISECIFLKFRPVNVILYNLQGNLPFISFCRSVSF